ncbi:hypothetical protein [Hydrogenophaga sp. BPS33]|uniref:hypothetical protein n=1 Tax=Hydrogenophaga sp. BPS33 TaxID=2651974 RepID=UPI00131F8781|nr:hypothetical protein [Hydrogenophaga sp. BPS33]QHE89125.1 hypothetical protein F9K07_29465 [Hydrogenophaga sp. BPS33]
MKKPVLAALGVAGACVACCTIPLAIPLFGGAAALGLTSWLGVKFQIGLELLVVMVIASITVMVWAAMAWTGRRRSKAFGSEPLNGSACSVDQDAQGCGCGPNRGQRLEG